MLPDLDPPELGNEDPQFQALLERARRSPVIYLISADPPRLDDSPEVARIKASAAAEDFCARLRARGERVTLVPPPVAGWTAETGGAA